MTQMELADAAGISQALVALAEMGTTELKDDMAERLGRACGVPPSYLLEPGSALPEGSLGLLRARSTKAGKADMAEARALACVGLDLFAFLSRRAKVPPARLPRLTGATVDEAAPIVRSSMALAPHEPIKNLIVRAERVGVIVLAVSGLSKEIDGFCAWVGEPGTERPVVVFRKGMTAFRQRFTIAHELGHLVMGHEAFRGPIREIESEAHRFAGCLLYPSDVARDEAQAGTDLMALARIKSKWGLSMQAAIERLHEAGGITDRQARRLRGAIGDKNWKLSEPGDVSTAPERPTLIDKLMELKGYTGAGATIRLASDSRLPVKALDRILSDDGQDARLAAFLGIDPSTPIDY